MRVGRVEAVRCLGTGAALDFSTRCAVLDSFRPDPVGELLIRVPEEELDELATVIAVDFV